MLKKSLNGSGNFCAEPRTAITCLSHRNHRTWRRRPHHRQLKILTEDCHNQKTCHGKPATLSVNTWMPRTNANLVRTSKIARVWQDKTTARFDVHLCFTDKSVGWMHKTGEETPNKHERQRRNGNNLWSRVIPNNQTPCRCWHWSKRQNINKPCEQHVN